MDDVSLSAGILLMSYQLISTYMAIVATVLWSHNIKVITTGKITQLWNSGADFCTCCLPHKKNCNAVVMDYISIRR